VAQNQTGAQSGGRSEPFPPLNPETFAPQLVWLAITFGLLYLLLKRLILPRLGSVLEARKERIRDDVAEAETMRGATAQALSRYEEALADARSEATGLLNAARDRLKAEIDEKRANAEAEITARIAAAEQRIAEAKAKALVNVEEIALDVAGALVTHLIGKEMSKAEVKRALVRHAAE
jgi:F-type H+-transporting ATPase subunit b